MTGPLVSVVIPIHDRAHLLERALRSVIGQTIHDWEAIVVDDGSIDHPRGVMEGIGDGRFRYLRHPARFGASAARNTGIDAADGRYVAFLDSDDEWLPEKLERQLEAFRSSDLPRLGVVYCGTRWGDGSPAHDAELRGRPVEELLESDRGFPTSSFLASREVVEAGVRFDEELPTFEDWDFLLQAARQFALEVVPDRMVVQHRDPAERHLWSGGNIPRGRQQLLAKYTAELPSTALALHHRRLARELWACGDISSATGHLLRAIQIHPAETARAAGRSVRVSRPDAT